MTTNSAVLIVVTASWSGNCYSHTIPFTDRELVRRCLALEESWGGWEQIRRMRLAGPLQGVLDRFKWRWRLRLRFAKPKGNSEILN